MWLTLFKGLIAGAIVVAVTEKQAEKQRKNRCQSKEKSAIASC